MKYKLVLILSLALCGCSKETSDDGVPSLEGGTWKTSCLSSSGAYQIKSTAFGSGSYTHTMSIYTNSTCTGKAVDLTEKGTYIIGGVAQAGSSSKELDRTLVDMTMTPLTTLAANNYNSMSFCGFTNWTAGVTKSLLGLTCSSSSMPNAGAVYYDVYSIGSVDIPGVVQKGILNFGFADSTYDGSAPSKRPVFMTSPDYKKQ